MNLWDVLIAEKLSGSGGIEPSGTIEITQNGTVDVANYATAEVNVSSGSSEAEEKNVNFRDYDGTIVYSYTAQEALALNALPANPTHSGLTAQGWNYTLAEVKTEVNAQGQCEVGQMYVTESGKTEIDIEVASMLSMYLNFAVVGTVVIDWGDGSQTDAVTGTSTGTRISTLHTYASTGKYTISIQVTNGTLYLTQPNQSGMLIDGGTNTQTTNIPYASVIKAVRVGNGANLQVNAFSYCYGIKYVTIPKNTVCGNSAMCAYCRGLKHITLPHRDDNASISSNCFNNCTSLQSISIPKCVKSISDSAFASASTINRIILPSNIDSIASSVFSMCTLLQKFVVPGAVTTIGASAMSFCPLLNTIIIPSGVTSIASKAFNFCYGMLDYYLMPTTPPTLANTDAFKSINADCKLHVPYSADHSILNAYQTATNWSTYASYMVEEPAS